MKTKHLCEICGFESENEKSVHECEDKGSKAEFYINQNVAFLYKPDTEHLVIEGKITLIHFEEKTHSVSYTIFVENEPRLGLRANNSTHTKIPERNVTNVNHFDK